MLLASHLPALRQLRIVLASQSPRRREILEKCSVPFEQVASTFAEDLDKAAFASPAGYVVENAWRKAMEIALRDSDGDAGAEGEGGAAAAGPDREPGAAPARVAAAGESARAGSVQARAASWCGARGRGGDRATTGDRAPTPALERQTW